jgi:hypothetical protein
MRAQKHSIPFGHWYIDGGTPVASSLVGTEILSYAQLDPIRDAVVSRLRSMTAAGVGTEARRSALMRLTPDDLGLKGEGPERVRNHFKVTVLSEGSGVQFFSTTFVQWAVREVLRRAQPVTLVARFAPRMTERSMNEALMEGKKSPVLDAHGALIDADMGAYYTWINQMRLAGADESSFLVWFENHGEALVISPKTPRGAESNEPVERIHESGRSQHFGGTLPAEIELGYCNRTETSLRYLPGLIFVFAVLGFGQIDVHAQRNDSLLNGTMIGAAVGAGAGVAFTHAVRDSDLTAGQYLRGALVVGAIGAGAGLGVDALLNQTTRPVIRSRRLQVMPALWRDFAAVAVHWKW